ncbi:hypothetical protein [Curtobacterium sp. Leaf261]|uniref:hypothetical protein n=1 Tax=Curtobacterium sp. Leaf261 TaxID=1736311 RepID=UPI000701AC65|nr:hypothetical protein [Curtobacterium sp. Leaf261]KQO61402.1 hypothetical protein ASF23_13075 [Curtobacterium sp. Leaf261]
MPLITFRERMVGPADIAPDTAVTLPPRGRTCGDGLFAAAAAATAVRTGHETGARAGARPGARPVARPGRAALPPEGELDLRDLDVRVDGIDPGRDGFRGAVERGTVHGAVTGTVVAGFVDLLTEADHGRRMYYRLLVRPVVEPGWLVVEGVKELRSGAFGAWHETTTLATRVVRLTPDDALRVDVAADRGRVLVGSFTDARVVLVGTLRVRGLVRQASSMRGSRLRFLGGFVRRVVR